MAKKKNNKVSTDDSVSADDQVTDISEVEVKKLISKGKEKGYITYDELNSVLSPEKFSSEKIEDIQAMISDVGISLVDTDDESNDSDTEVVGSDTTKGEVVKSTNEEEQMIQ